MKRVFRAAAVFFPLLYVGARDRLNVVWIIADDLGPELGCYDYADVATPNLDRLVKEGIGRGMIVEPCRHLISSRLNGRICR